MCFTGRENLAEKPLYEGDLQFLSKLSSFLKMLVSSGDIQFSEKKCLVFEKCQFLVALFSFGKKCQFMQKALVFGQMSELTTVIEKCNTPKLWV